MSEASPVTHQITAAQDEGRLDQFLTGKLDGLSRAKVQALIKDGLVTLEGRSLKSRHSVSAGETFSVEIPPEAPALPQAQELPLDILFEDDHLIVVNKAHGMVVHPANGNEDGTLVNALLHHCKGNLAAAAGDERPGIVHRLDKDTSGCLIAAKTDEAYFSLTKQFAERSTDKRYFAVVQGSPAERQGTVFTNIGRHPVNRQKMAVIDPPNGKSAITDYEVVDYLETSDSSLVLCTLHTGRTHQIRVHMLHLGHPIIADPIYAKPQRQKAKTGRLMLHAFQLSIDHPITHERMDFEAPVPKPFDPWMNQARPKL